MHVPTIKNCISVLLIRVLKESRSVFTRHIPYYTYKTNLYFICLTYGVQLLCVVVCDHDIGNYTRWCPVCWKWWLYTWTSKCRPGALKGGYDKKVIIFCCHKRRQRWFLYNSHIFNIIRLLGKSVCTLNLTRRGLLVRSIIHAGTQWNFAEKAEPIFSPPQANAERSAVCSAWPFPQVRPYSFIVKFLVSRVMFCLSFKRR